MQTPTFSFSKILPTFRAIFHPKKDIALGMTPITQAEWREIVELNPDCGLDPDPSYFKGDNRPVESVSYEDVCTWLRLLNKHLEEMDCSYEACIPTEKEWVEFASAGRNCEYPTGDKINVKLANYNSNYEGTTPVMSFLPNPWGLYDMAGNVFEFTEEEVVASKKLSLEDTVSNLEKEIERLKQKLAEAGDQTK